MKSGPETSPTFLDHLRDPSNEAAWRRFVELYCPIVYRLAKRKGLDRDAAEIVVQEFCVRMVRYLQEFQYDRERGRFRGWIRKVATHEIFRYWRKQSAGKPKSTVSIDGDNDIVPDEGEDNWWEGSEIARLLQLALNDIKGQVSTRDYEVFRKLVLDSQTVDTVSLEFGITPNHIYGIKFRLLRMIREQAHRLREEWYDR